MERHWPTNLPKLAWERANLWALIPKPDQESDVGTPNRDRERDVYQRLPARTPQPDPSRQASDGGKGPPESSQQRYEREIMRAAESKSLESKPT